MPCPHALQPARAHRCLICEANTHYFFSKEYRAYPDSPFSDALRVDYWKCENCGFVISRTHQEMTTESWSKLNTSWHHYFENDLEAQAAQITNQPPYADQALALMMLSKNKAVDVSDTLDYAAGYGTLSKFLLKYMDTKIKIHDHYVRGDDKNLDYADDADLKKFKLVINSAMFEHILTRDDLNEVNDLVADDGVLMLHTVICERIPSDPNWFYIEPIVHTAFHTNKSMSLLMKQWGYAASIYSPQAKCWFLFKKDCPQLSQLEDMVNRINREIQTRYFFYKADFVDYWKGF
jgi:hypothetical protein